VGAIPGSNPAEKLHLSLISPFSINPDKIKTMHKREGLDHPLSGWLRGGGGVYGQKSWVEEDVQNPYTVPESHG
jgi:hypothetical protein